MSFICNLFNPSVLIFLALLCLILACLVLYFEHKMREQNHKIASMLSLVSSLAEEMNHTKLVLGTLNLSKKPNHSGMHFFDKQLFDKQPDSLIPVSDDDDNEDDDNDDNDDDDNEDEDNDEDNEDIESVYLDNKNIETDKEIKLNDMESPDSDIDTDENDNMFFSQASPLSLNHIMASILQNSQIINMNRNDLVNQESVSPKITILESDVDNETTRENHEVTVNEVHENKINDLKTIDLSSINISTVENVIMTNETNMNENETDYKKMSVQKLRSIVFDKGLSPDPSKTKKPELLKLLELSN